MRRLQEIFIDKLKLIGKLYVQKSSPSSLKLVNAAAQKFDVYLVNSSVKPQPEEVASGVKNTVENLRRMLLNFNSFLTVNLNTIIFC